MRIQVTLLTLAVAWMGACGHDVEQDLEGEPFDDRSNEIFQGIYDCSERNDTGYRNGNSYSIKVVTVDGKPVQLATANAYIAMQAKAKQQGVNIRVVSGFRTMAQQEYLYGCYVNCNCNSCNLAARPGYSNHQSGHALDLNTADGGVLSWLNAHADEFGFARTVPSEPWHWEYWGAVDFNGPCGGPPIPRECDTGNFDGEFCDDDGRSTEEQHDRLKDELGVNFHCSDIAGEPAFCASKEATRAQAMFVLGEAADVPLSGHPNAFTDDNGHARERYMNAARAYGILKGYDDGTKGRPDAIASRATLAIMLDRMYKLPPTDQDFFDDDDDNANEDVFNRVAKAGLFTGYADGNGGRKDFKPAQKATRATLAVLAVRAHDKGLVPVWDIPQPCLDGQWTGTFCDEDGAAVEPQIEELVAAGLNVQKGQLAGSPTFRPSLEGSRAEAMFILGGAAGVPLDGHPDAFNDDDGHRRERYMNAAKAFGILVGYDNGTEGRPNVIATRTTAAIMLARMYALPAATEDYFTDDNGSANEAVHNKVGAAGLFTGFDDGNGGRAFRGSRPITRGALATLASRAKAAGLLPVWAPTPAPAPAPAPVLDDEDPADDPANVDADDDTGAGAGAGTDGDDPLPTDDEPVLDVDGDDAAVASDPEGPPGPGEEGLEVFDGHTQPSVSSGCASSGAGSAPAGVALAVLALVSRRRRSTR